MIEKLLLVALGGALGASARFVGVAWATRVFGASFPWGTLIVNVLGSFVMGLLVVLLVERAPEGAVRLAPLVLTGILGGFTTFSAFSLDAMQLIERGRWFAALGYASASVGVSIVALGLGMLLVRGALS